MRVNSQDFDDNSLNQNQILKPENKYAQPLTKIAEIKIIGDRVTYSVRIGLKFKKRRF